MKKFALSALIAACCLLPLSVLAADAPLPGLDSGKAALPSARTAAPDDDLITAVKAIDFLALCTTLGMEEMGDNGLESMVCTPHALPRKLFFQALCPCATDPETKISDLEILALNEEMDRSGESDDASLSLKDIDRDVTSTDFFLQAPETQVNACAYTPQEQTSFPSGTLPDGWTAQVLRTQSASF